MASIRLHRYSYGCFNGFYHKLYGDNQQWPQRLLSSYSLICRGADKSLAFPISYFPICSTTKRIFLGWVKEVRTTKSWVCGALGKYVE
jgi:hypothetical protein